MKIAAWTDLITKIFNKKDAEKFFDLPLGDILQYVESGKPIPVGQRYWYVDILRDEGE